MAPHVDEKLIFITGNSGKLREALEILPGIMGENIDLPEIQEVDAHKIIAAKLLEAQKHQKGQYIVEDTSLYFDCLNGLPGPLIKWFLEKMGDSGLYDLTIKFKNNIAEAKTIIGYINIAGEIRYFEGSIKGHIVRPKGENGFGWDRIFLPEGFSKTFAEMNIGEKNSISMRKLALLKLREVLYGL